MPPANTPSVSNLSTRLSADFSLMRTALQQSPPTAAAQSPYLEQLALLASPVPDLASTLTTQAEQDEANDANVSFLRTTISQAPSEPTSGTIDDLRQLRQRIRADRETRLHDTNDTESQRRMRRVMNRRYNPSELDESTNLQSASRLDPSWSPRPGYQGWAPSRGSSGNEAQSGAPSSNTRTSSATIADDQRRAQSMAMRQHQMQLSSTSTGNESSLRTAALLQSVRRNAQLSARSRSHLQHYILDREVVGDISPRTERQLSIGYLTLNPYTRQFSRDSTTSNENARPRADPWADLPQLQSRLLSD
ncbi:MAG: hypothetical protein Q9214_006797, partial [Letrouitia sp. 1 TL-2023]